MSPAPQMDYSPRGDYSPHEEYDTPQGKQSVKVCEKTWLPHELIRMAKTAGFEVLQVWGGTAGNWNRKVLELDEMEIMLLLRRQV